MKKKKNIFFFHICMYLVLHPPLYKLNFSRHTHIFAECPAYLLKYARVRIKGFRLFFVILFRIHICLFIFIIPFLPRIVFFQQTKRAANIIEIMQRTHFCVHNPFHLLAFTALHMLECWHK